jgi:beta-glucosidase
MYDLVTQISREYDHPVIEISENGCCYLDGPELDGRVPDGRRIAFHQQILAELARAIADGAKVRAYHGWTLVDNFEWADGYSQRYGFTWVDFKTLKRTVKDSGLWYGRVAATGRLNA